MKPSTDLAIEKMIYGGDGLARLPVDANGKRQAAFVPFVLQGEAVTARVTDEKRGFVRAWPEHITVPSQHRIAPGCPYFQKCGGCHYQHANYDHQLAIKQNILRETLLRTGKFDWKETIGIHSGGAWNYRNRTRLKVRGAGTAEFSLGYYRFASHQLLPVEHCPISSPLINRAIKAIWEIGKAGDVPQGINEIECFVNAEDNELLLEIYLGPPETGTTELEALAAKLAMLLPGFKGASAFSPSNDGKYLSGKASWSWGAEFLEYRTKSDSYRVRAGSFFQTNRFLTDQLINLATTNAQGTHAFDLYAGTGLFSLPLSRGFRQVTAVEAAPASFADLRSNAPDNVASIRGSIEDFLKKPQTSKPDFVLVDPPRAGLGDKVAAALASAAPAHIAYISCDPATLARDLRVMLAAGYCVLSIDMLDLFPQTFHFETIVHLLR